MCVLESMSNCETRTPARPLLIAMSCPVSSRMLERRMGGFLSFWITQSDDTLIANSMYILCTAGANVKISWKFRRAADLRFGT